VNEREPAPALPAFPGAARRRAVRAKGDDLVRMAALTPDGSLPLVVTPSIDGVDLLAWAGANRSLVEERLRMHGTVLFRGFGVDSASQFEAIVEAVAGATLEYRERSSPRSEVEGRVYTSTDYPPAYEIFLHNENSYAHSWPLVIGFCCLDPSPEGGATPIADCRKVVRSLNRSTVEAFARRQVLYVRNFGAGFGLPWQTVFQTADRAEVETYCHAAGLEFEWRDGDRLRTRRRAPALRRHPVTGEAVWFNHATFFHVSTLEPQVRAALLAEFGQDDMPNSTYYGDGGPIEPEVLDELRAAYRDATIAFPWQRGDVMLLDNMLVAHGRARYAGPRRVVVAMALPVVEDEAPACEVSPEREGS